MISKRRNVQDNTIKELLRSATPAIKRTLGDNSDYTYLHRLTVPEAITDLQDTIILNKRDYANFHPEGDWDLDKVSKSFWDAYYRKTGGRADFDQWVHDYKDGIRALQKKNEMALAAVKKLGGGNKGGKRDVGYNPPNAPGRHVIESVHGTYHIDPVETQYGRRKYYVDFQGEGIRKGTWEEVGVYGTLGAAKKAVQTHRKKLWSSNPVVDRKEVVSAGDRYVKAVQGGADPVLAFRKEYSKVSKYVTHPEFLKYVSGLLPKRGVGSVPAIMGNPYTQVIAYGARKASNGSGDYYPLLNGKPLYKSARRSMQAAENEAKRVAEAVGEDLRRAGYKVSIKKDNPQWYHHKTVMGTPGHRQLTLSDRRTSPATATKQIVSKAIRRGSRQVVISNQNTGGIFESRLYVNRGETATPTSARHKTLAGAVKWAEATLGVSVAGPRERKTGGEYLSVVHNNPPRGAVKIYDNVLAIEAQKGHSSMWPGEEFRHDFKKSKGKACVYGLPDGSLLIKGKKRLWKNFNYAQTGARTR